MNCHIGIFFVYLFWFSNKNTFLVDQSKQLILWKNPGIVDSGWVVVSDEPDINLIHLHHLDLGDAYESNYILILILLHLTFKQQIASLMLPPWASFSNINSFWLTSILFIEGSCWKDATGSSSCFLSWNDWNVSLVKSSGNSSISKHTTVFKDRHWPIKSKINIMVDPAKIPPIK